MQPTKEKYKYEYQGQEHQIELGLNWSSFKYRNYDYAIGRFMSVDPLAEKYPYNSTYAFSENRVIDKIELEGLEGVNFRFSLWMRSQGGIQKEAENYVVNKVKQVGYENEQKYHTLEFIIKNLTPVEDIYGVFAGKDFEGNEYNRGEAAFWAVLGGVPEIKVFKQ